MKNLKNSFIDFLRGGRWRGDSEVDDLRTEVDEPGTAPDEDDEDEELEALLEFLDETLDDEVKLYEYASADFRMRLEGLKAVAELLEDEPLAEEQHKALISRIAELEEHSRKETEEVCQFLHQRLEVLEEITGMTYGACDDDCDCEDCGEDEDESVEDDDDEEEDGDDVHGESFADLHGLDPNAKPEDVPEGD